MGTFTILVLPFALLCTIATSYPHNNRVLPRASEFDYEEDYSWIQSFAAVGDSYAAGIGVGQVLGQPDAVACSRYDGAYPNKMNAVIQAPNFQFIACSGDTSKDMIMNQIRQLSSNSYDLITVSAGGNDVGFADVLEACLFLPKPLEACEDALFKAETFIDTYLERSHYDLLSGLAPKLKPAGFFVQTLYGKFFSEEPSQCDNQSWCFFSPTVDGCLKVNVDMRKEFNRLVGKTNERLVNTINLWNQERRSSPVFAAHWGGWPMALGGQFCEPGSADRIDDPSNVGLAFIRPSVGDVFIPPDKRDLELIESTTGDNLTARSIDDDTSLRKRLNIPDAIAKYFHPTDWGTDMQAAIALSAVSAGWKHVNGVSGEPQDICQVPTPTPSGVVGGSTSTSTLSGTVGGWTPSATPSSPPATGGSTPVTGGQQIAVASYIHPLADPDAWARLIQYPNHKLSVLVANVVNGPDATVNEDWKRVISAAAAGGKRVIGYVRTGYLGVSEQQFKTRLGSADLADWVAQIERDVDMWYQLYPGSIGGIFFDEGWNDCGPNNVYSELYRHINENTKRKYPGAFTVLNPGTNMPQCFENSADTLMTFESSYETYTTNYKPNDWSASDTRKLWHIIYNVPEAEVGRIAALASQRGAGMIEITNDVLDNPYDNLPNDAYMQEHMNAVVGGEPKIADVPLFTEPGGPTSTASTPGGLTVTGFEYTSVSLSWLPASNAIGYRVYQDGQLALSLTSAMTRVTLGNLSPGASGYTFYVTAEDGDGTESGKSNSVSSGTKTPPNPGKYVFNLKSSTSATSTTYKADIVIPYAFVRVYIWDSDVACDFDKNPGWPINFATANYVCTHYMIEGAVLYKFSGTVPSGTVNVPWAWSSVGGVGVAQNGYTFTWTIPIGTSTTDTSKFVIQTEGYGPKANVFQPCPSFGGGPSGDGRYCS